MRPYIVDESPARLQATQPQAQGPPQALGRMHIHGSGLPQRGPENAKRYLKALLRSGGIKRPVLPNCAPAKANQNPHRLQEAGVAHVAWCSSSVSRRLVLTFLQYTGTWQSGSAGGAVTAGARGAATGLPACCVMAARGHPNAHAVMRLNIRRRCRSNDASSSMVCFCLILRPCSPTGLAPRPPPAHLA